MNKKTILEIMEGNEIQSLTFEGTVLVKNGNVIQNGEIKKANLNQLKNLLNELFYQEFGYYKFNPKTI